MESMRGWPSHEYMAHIQMIRSWMNQVHTVPPAFTTSNKLITVDCSHIQERLGVFINARIPNFICDELKGENKWIEKASTFLIATRIKFLPLICHLPVSMFFQFIIFGKILL